MALTFNQMWRQVILAWEEIHSNGQPLILGSKLRLRGPGDHGQVWLLHQPVVPLALLEGSPQRLGHHPTLLPHLHPLASLLTRHLLRRRQQLQESIRGPTTHGRRQLQISSHSLRRIHSTSNSSRSRRHSHGPHSRTNHLPCHLEERVSTWATRRRWIGSRIR